MASDKGPFYRALGGALRKARVAKGIKQGPLAGAVGLSRTSITNIERGRQPIEVEVLVRLAMTLGTSVTDLIPMREVTERALPRKARHLDPQKRAWVRRIISPVDGGGEGEKNGSTIRARTTKSS